MDKPACTVECAGIEDIPAMLSFEKKYMETCWQSKSTIMKKLIEKDPRMFRVCKVANKIKGYYGVIPLPHAIWQKLIKGNIKEEEAIPHIQSFDAPEIYLYIYLIIVDIADKKHKIYTEALVNDFAQQYLLGQSNKTSNIKAVGAFTVSEGGTRLAERGNFKYYGSFRGMNGKYLRSYAIKRENLAKQFIKTGEQHKKKDIA